MPPSLSQPSKGLKSKCYVIKSKDMAVSSWSGGTTTELFIFPRDAHYQNRDFEFRLSKAHVTAVQSDFTVLADVQRKMLILEGNIDLIHDSEPPYTLARHEQTSFSGHQNTSSKGRCVDFNLMYKTPSRNELSIITLESSEEKVKEMDGILNWFFVYIFKGTVMMSIEEEEMNPVIAETGDLVVMESPSVAHIKLRAQGTSEIVLTSLCR